MAKRNPPWNRDELILALDLYMVDPISPPGKQSREILELSDYLNRLGSQVAADKATYRNPNGVYMKLMNFRRFDPTFIGAGKVGLQRGGKGDERVWNDFAGDRAQLHTVAAAIRAAIDAEVAAPPVPSEEEETAEAMEGRILTRLHRSRERNRKLVERKKAKALREQGRLRCEACGFDFEEVYGERGRGFIECHHIRPVHTLVKGSMTNLDDLALLCSNCHRMVHAAQPWLTVEELRVLIRTKHPVRASVT